MLRTFRPVDGGMALTQYVGSQFWATIQIGDDANHVMIVRGDEVECTCNIATCTDDLDRDHLTPLRSAHKRFAPNVLADIREARERRQREAELQIP